MLPLSNLLVFQTHLENFTKYGSLGTSLGDRFDLDIGSNSYLTVVDMEVVRKLLYLCYVLREVGLLIPTLQVAKLRSRNGK